MKDSDVNAVIIQLRAGYSTPELEKQLKEGEIGKIAFANILMSRAQQSNNQVQYEQSLFENNHTGIMQQYNLVDEPKGIAKINKDFRELKKLLTDPIIQKVLLGIAGVGLFYYQKAKGSSTRLSNQAPYSSDSEVSLQISDKHKDLVKKSLESLSTETVMIHIREIEASVRKNPTNQYNRAFYKYYVSKLQEKLNSENEVNKLENKKTDGITEENEEKE